MAENEDGQEKTEQPTEKRLRDAREKGQVARSKELGTAAVFVVATCALLAFGGWSAGAAGDWMRHALSIEPGLADGGRGLAPRFGELLLRLLYAIWPLVAACFIACFIPPVLMGGFNFSTKALVPDFKKLDPIKGLKRIYGPDGAMELLKSVLRVIFISGFAAAAMIWAAPRFVTLMHQPLGSGAANGFGLALLTMLAMGAGLGILAAIDAPYQRWSHRRKLMMTRQELRDEFKESEGRPEVKAKIRQLQQQMSQRKMMEDLPRADVILVNPTHYAVALRYAPGETRAPLLLAKGVDEMARIIRVAGEGYGIPIVSSPPLARALYRQVDIGREIPVDLYAAVAQILSYIYQLRHFRSHGGRMPEPPRVDLDEPE